MNTDGHGGRSNMTRKQMQIDARRWAMVERHAQGIVWCESDTLADGTPVAGTWITRTPGETRLAADKLRQRKVADESQ